MSTHAPEFCVDPIDRFMVRHAPDLALGDLLRICGVAIPDPCMLALIPACSDPEEAVTDVALTLFEIVAENQTIAQVVGELAKQGHRPANLKQTLGALSQTPRLERFPAYLALGSCWKGEDAMHVPCLIRWRGKRELNSEVEDALAGLQGHYMFFGLKC